MQCSCLQGGVPDAVSDDIVIDLCGSSSDEDAGPDGAHSTLRQQLGCTALVKQQCSPAPWCARRVAEVKQHGSPSPQSSSDQGLLQRLSICAGGRQAQLQHAKQQPHVPPAGAGAAAPSPPTLAAPAPREVNHLAAATAKMSAAMRGGVSTHVWQAAVAPRSRARQDQTAADGAPVLTTPPKVQQQGMSEGTATA